MDNWIPYKYVRDIIAKQFAHFCAHQYYINKLLMIIFFYSTPAESLLSLLVNFVLRRADVFAHFEVKSFSNLLL